MGSMVWTLPFEHAKAVERIHRESLQTSESGVQPFAELVTAAFRLPWAHIDSLFQQIIAQSRASEETQDWTWLITSIAQAVEASGGLESLPDSETGAVPPAVRSIDAKSVASFPLQVKHADAYLGASLLSETAEGSSFISHLPSRLLNTSLTMFGFAGASSTSAPAAATSVPRGRTVLVGDAAHSIHPLAGQGLNLGIADARSLVQTLTAAIADGADIGSFTALKSYPRQRYWENQKMLSAVDHLHWLYAAPVPAALASRLGSHSSDSTSESPLRALAREGIARGALWARSTGLEVINELGPIKKAFMRQAGARAGSTSGSASSRNP